MRLPMRLSLMFLTGVFIAIPCFAGESKIAKKDIPEKVLKAFHKTYPGIQIRDQTMIMEGAQRLYELEYSISKVEHDVTKKPMGLSSKAL